LALHLLFLLLPQFHVLLVVMLGLSQRVALTQLLPAAESAWSAAQHQW
jgi:hypothetical protein